MLPSDIADVLRARMRKGQGLSVPYARKWAVGGCEPIQSLRSYPYDGLLLLGTGLSELRHAVVAYPDGLVIDGGLETIWVAANRSMRGDGPPDGYLVGTGGDQNARYVGDTAEIVIQIVRGMPEAAPALPAVAGLQVGFPGLENTTKTYVGSWQWGVHGEATDDEFVRRAANATLTAIEAKKERDAGHRG
ncbi:hypothetical protein [Mycobacterium sp. AZCC_0083]|uniref:hypothetical protein n=1 Tax=Mycobacterium sp. AZCC_0083 TaxID=2735882 RepID=UPI00161E8642|nr:hypothetical protein [Mycobacterium sp. AZCC_0083]MBB5165779.1 hypothetical protein [Mycobacterium sp. AZCC_0083]